MASIERESIPRLGIATDLRTMRHIGEVFFEDNVKPLMCFICSCKHLYHYGYNKFGIKYSKGNIDYRSNGRDQLRKVVFGEGSP